MRVITEAPEFEVSCVGEMHPDAPGRRRSVLCVSGEVDLMTAPRLAAAVAGALAGSRPDVVVDLARVGFIGVTGIRVLLTAAQEARRAGGGLVVRSPSQAVRRMLDLLQVDGSLLVEQ
jgi:anti-sigma B factor antagonist